MLDVKLLKLVKAKSKKDKIFYLCKILIGTEVISTYIYENQFNSIVSLLSEQEKKAIYVDCVK